VDSQLAIYDAVSSGATLQDILDKFVGMTYSDADRQSTMISLYIMNKFGVGGRVPELDDAIKNFVTSVTSFFNEPWFGQFSSILDQTREPSEEAKERYDYAGYAKLRAKRSEITRKIIRSGRDTDARDAAKAERATFEQGMKKHPWSGFSRQVYNAHRDHVAKRDNHVLTQEDVTIKDTRISLMLKENYDILVGLLVQQRR